MYSKYINQSRILYEKIGYTTIEVPWIVPRAIIDITKPKDSPTVKTMVLENCHSSMYIQDDYLNGELIGSGEQGFLDLMINRRTLYKGFFQTTTPCFRKEITYNSEYRPYFTKLELISVNPENPKKDFDKIVHDAFYVQSNWNDIKKVEVDENQIDFYCGEVELGSYGIRTVKAPDYFGGTKTIDITWIYGTGLAEPRCSQCMKVNCKYGY